MYKILINNNDHHDRDGLSSFQGPNMSATRLLPLALVTKFERLLLGFI